MFLLFSAANSYTLGLELGNKIKIFLYFLENTSIDDVGVL